jgi:hypothetical protein
MQTVHFLKAFDADNNFLYTVNDQLVDANTEYVTQLIIFKESKTIRYVHVYFSAVANAGDVRVSFQGINDTALPSVKDGTILGVGNSAYGTATISAAGWYRIQLNTDYTPAMGDMCFLCNEPTNFQAGDSYTIGGSSVRLAINNLYKHYSSTGVFAANAIMSYALESTDGTFILCDLPNPCYITSLTVDNTTTPDEIGNVFILPTRCTIIGAKFMGDLDGACDIKLYGTTTKTFSTVANRRYNANVNSGEAIFTSEYIVEANETFRMSILPTTATAGTVRDYTYPTSYESAVKTMFFGSDVTINKTSRKSAGAWTDDSTKVVGIVPLISDIEIPPYSHFTNLLGA